MCCCWERCLLQLSTHVRRLQPPGAEREQRRAMAPVSARVLSILAPPHLPSRAGTAAVLALARPGKHARCTQDRAQEQTRSASHRKTHRTLPLTVLISRRRAHAARVAANGIHALRLAGARVCVHVVFALGARACAPLAAGAAV